jgi:hypothetical protein
MLSRRGVGTRDLVFLGSSWLAAGNVAVMSGTNGPTNLDG